MTTYGFLFEIDGMLFQTSSFKSCEDAMIRAAVMCCRKGWLPSQLTPNAPEDTEKFRNLVRSTYQIMMREGM